jgi:hypothetical protein
LVKVVLAAKVAAKLLIAAPGRRVMPVRVVQTIKAPATAHLQANQAAPVPQVKPANPDRLVTNHGDKETYIQKGY